MSRPLISIITPCYNHESFIAECIESVISQTYKNWEMIIIDDRSQDASFEIVKSYANSDPRIKAIRHERNYGAGGLERTYNEALALCSGELIAILEGDDFWNVDKLATQVLAFRDDNVVLIYSDFDEITATGELIKHHRVRIDRGSLTTTPPQNLEFLSRLGSFGASSVVVRKTALSRTGGFISSNIPTVDFPTWLKLSLEGSFVCVPKPFVSWRRHRNSIYFNNAEAIAEGVARCIREFLQDNRKKVEQYGLVVDTMCDDVERALRWQRATARYFEGKYQLIFGDRKKARECFFSAVKSSDTPLKNKVAAVIGIFASLISKRILLSFSNMQPLSSQKNRR